MTGCCSLDKMKTNEIPPREGRREGIEHQIREAERDRDPGKSFFFKGKLEMYVCDYLRDMFGLLYKVRMVVMWAYFGET